MNFYSWKYSLCFTHLTDLFLRNTNCFRILNGYCIYVDISMNLIESILLSSHAPLCGANHLKRVCVDVKKRLLELREMKSLLLKHYRAIPIMYCVCIIIQWNNNLCEQTSWNYTQLYSENSNCKAATRIFTKKMLELGDFIFIVRLQAQFVFLQAPGNVHSFKKFREP